MTNPLDTFTAAEIEVAMAALTSRERRIFEALRLAKEPITLEQLALEFGVARERVRQMDVRALEKVQSAIEASRVKKT